MWFRVNMSKRPLSPKILYEKLFYFFRCVFPHRASTNFLQSTVPVRSILAHICQTKWNFISFHNENDEKTLNKRSYTEKKHLSIYL